MYCNAKISSNVVLKHDPISQKKFIIEICRTILILFEAISYRIANNYDRRQSPTSKTSTIAQHLLVCGLLKNCFSLRRYNIYLRVRNSIKIGLLLFTARSL